MTTIEMIINQALQNTEVNGLSLAQWVSYESKIGRWDDITLFADADRYIRNTALGYVECPSEKVMSETMTLAFLLIKLQGSVNKEVLTAHLSQNL